MWWGEGILEALLGCIREGLLRCIRLVVRVYYMVCVTGCIKGVVILLCITSVRA